MMGPARVLESLNVAKKALFTSTTRGSVERERDDALAH